MAFRTLKTLTLVAFVMFSHIMIDNRVEGRKKEDIELERQLKILNKPAVKTIKTEFGDIYDCVDMNKQPALDHPLLKDHKIQVRPTHLQKKFDKDSLKRRQLAANGIKVGLKSSCPPGTVPIRRTKKEDLINAKSLFKRNDANIHPMEQGIGYEFAGIQTNAEANKTYYGTGAWIDIYNPRVEPRQFSAAMITIQDGPENELNNIKFGWMVHPKLYGDSYTRLFTSWTADSHLTTGCYNTHCPGFVIVNSEIPLDLVFLPTSTIGGDQYEVKVQVFQDSSGWWLTIFEDDIPIGYWPNSIFTHLADGATYLEWGGQVYTPLDMPKSPPMGSGVFNNGLYRETCYFREVLYGDRSGFLTDVDDSLVHVADSRCYYAGNNEYVDRFWGYRFDFGGYGGDEYTCIP